MITELRNIITELGNIITELRNNITNLTEVTHVLRRCYEVTQVLRRCYGGYAGVTQVLRRLRRCYAGYAGVTEFIFPYGGTLRRSVTTRNCVKLWRRVMKRNIYIALHWSLNSRLFLEIWSSICCLKSVWKSSISESLLKKRVLLPIKNGLVHRVIRHLWVMQFESWSDIWAWEINCILIIQVENIFGISDIII